ncbi:AAA family ATPase [Streptomyces tricolor]|nr:AAA family ATPase [Streptomyces tricolor]
MCSCSGTTRAASPRPPRACTRPSPDRTARPTAPPTEKKSPAPLWPVYTGTNEPHDGIAELPPAAALAGLRRRGRRSRRRTRKRTPPPSPPTAPTAPRPTQATPETVQLVNAALYLRRPLLVTGPPGTGKSSLVYAVARELRLGPVLRWNITSRSTLHDGLYQYDPLSRLYAAR